MSSTSERQTWRVIVDEEPLSGAWNMALDRAIQLLHAEQGGPPTLRLYGWARPTLTLGRFQSVERVDQSACRDSGVDVVRRFTGGRGVLHYREVTYSIVAGLADGVPRGTAASYRMLCGALLEAYGELGVVADLTARPRGTRDSAACYLHATNADLSLGTRKLSGSAQVWYRNTVLQHGSLVITRDAQLEARIMSLSPAEHDALVAGTATIAEALGDVPSTDRIREALMEGLRTAMDVELEPGNYSDADVERARGLLGEVGILGVRDPGPTTRRSIRVE